MNAFTYAPTYIHTYICIKCSWCVINPLSASRLSWRAFHYYNNWIKQLNGSRSGRSVGGWWVGGWWLAGVRGESEYAARASSTPSSTAHRMIVVRLWNWLNFYVPICSAFRLNRKSQIAIAIANRTRVFKVKYLTCVPPLIVISPRFKWFTIMKNASNRTHVPVSTCASCMHLCCVHLQQLHKPTSLQLPTCFIFRLFYFSRPPPIYQLQLLFWMASIDCRRINHWPLIWCRRRRRRRRRRHHRHRHQCYNQWTNGWRDALMLQLCISM